MCLSSFSKQIGPLLLAALPIASLATTTALVPYGSQYSRVAIDGVPSTSTRAPFGSGGSCPLQAKVRTEWPTDTHLVIGKPFYLDAAATNVTVYLVVDNDAKVYVNGQLIGSAVVHEFCPVKDENVLVVPPEVLVPGRNTLQVKAVDRGAGSFLDVKVIAELP